MLLDRREAAARASAASALYSAAKNGRAQALNFLLDRSLGSVNENLVWAAMLGGQYEVTRDLCLRRSADSDALVEWKRPILMEATWLRDDKCATEIVRVLLDNGADPNLG